MALALAGVLTGANTEATAPWCTGSAETDQSQAGQDKSVGLARSRVYFTPPWLPTAHYKCVRPATRPCTGSSQARRAMVHQRGHLGVHL